MVHLNKSHYQFWLDRYRKKDSWGKKISCWNEIICLNYNPKGGDSIGEIVKFPLLMVMLNMVLKFKPLCLIHLPLNDAYNFSMLKIWQRYFIIYQTRKDWGNYIKERLNTLWKLLTFKIRRVEIFLTYLCLEFKNNQNERS
jgi:hypothetical protein